MERTLNRRLLRDLKANFGRYLALFLMIVLGVYLVVGIVGASELVIIGTKNMKEVNRAEDGEFSVFAPLSDETLGRLTADGTYIEEMFSTDLAGEDGSTVRVFAVRKDIDLIVLDSGHTAENRAEAVFEKNYAKAHNLKVGDSFIVGGRTYTVCGLGSVPDYDQVLKTFASPAVDVDTFGVMCVSDAEYADIRESLPEKVETYTYAYRLGDTTDDDLKDALSKSENVVLLSFTTYADNLRIEGAAGDVIMDKRVGLVAGIIVLILFAYVISVFVLHQIEREQSVIGALYALGVKKRQLMAHYVILPTIVALLAGVAGTVLGFSPLGIGVMKQSTYDYFSIPEYEMVYPAYLVVYGIVIPPVICALVNLLTINKKLSRTALSLLRNEQSASNYRRVNLKIKNFSLLFAIRQLIREMRSSITLVLGMVITLMVIVLGINTYVLCSRVRDYNTEDTKYNYMYLYKFPDNEVPAGGEGTYVETLGIDCEGYMLDVTVIGIDRDKGSRYFDAAPETGKSQAVINRSMVERFGYDVGDKIVLTDSAADMDYCFTATAISEYRVGFTIFMDIAGMRELFGKNEGYINAVYSDEELAIDEARLYSVTTKEEIRHSSAVFLTMMVPMTVTLISAGIVIFCVVMFLMMAVVIDRSTMGISLIKIFGYRPGEIRSLYLNGNLLVIAVGGLLTIPLAKGIIDKLYPSFIANVACSMDLAYPWYYYLGIYGCILLVYLAVNRLLVSKINRITPAEILKDRE